MCNALNWTIRTGTSKQKQIEELNNYCTYEREGNKYIIKEVFTTEEIQEREYITYKYGEYIEKLILFELSQRPLNKDGYTIVLSKNELYKTLNMVNCNYNICRNNINKFSRYIQVPTIAVYDFYNNTSSKLKDNVDRVLNKLQNQCLITWEYRKHFKRRDNGNVSKVTDHEENIIIEAEREALKELKEETKGNVFKRGKWNDFTNLINKNLEDTNILYYFQVYHINTTKDFRNILDNINIEEYKGELNATLYVSTIETAKRRNNKIKDKYKVNSFKEGVYFSSPVYENEKVQIMDEYINFTRKIANNVIEYDTYKIDLEGLKSERYSLDEYLIDTFDTVSQINYIDELTQELFQ